MEVSKIQKQNKAEILFTMPLNLKRAQARLPTHTFSLHMASAYTHNQNINVIIHRKSKKTHIIHFFSATGFIHWNNSNG